MPPKAADNSRRYTRLSQQGIRQGDSPGNLRSRGQLLFSSSPTVAAATAREQDSGIPNSIGCKWNNTKQGLFSQITLKWHSVPLETPEIVTETLVGTSAFEKCAPLRRTGSGSTEVDGSSPDQIDCWSAIEMTTAPSGL